MPSPTHRQGVVPWWAVVLAVVCVGIYAMGVVQQFSCIYGACVLPRPVGLHLDPDAIGGIPRLFTSGLFLGVTLFAGRGALASRDGVRGWWSMVSLIGLGLTVLKLTSEHSVLESDVGDVLTLGGAVAVVAVGAVGLLWWARRVSVPRAVPVVLALCLYSAAALGLDQVTAAFWRVDRWKLALVATSVEEAGEALTALVLLVVVRWAAGRVAGAVAVSSPGRHAQS